MLRPTEDQALYNIDKNYRFIDNKFRPKTTLTKTQIRLLILEREIIESNPNITKRELDNRILLEFPFTLPIIDKFFGRIRRFLYERLT